MFDDQLLEDFAQNFYGYGNYKADYWFIGMEEGGGNSVTDISSRLNAWIKRGRRELENLAGYHAEFGISNLFGPNHKLQSTWGKLIRVLLSAKGPLPTIDEVRKYQGLHLGRSSGDTCLLELLPLPSPSTNNWLYGQHSQLPYLTNRETYKQMFITLRIALLKDRIIEHGPKVVIFYSHSLSNTLARDCRYWPYIRKDHYEWNDCIRGDKTSSSPRYHERIFSSFR